MSNSTRNHQDTAGRLIKEMKKDAIAAALVFAFGALCVLFARYLALELPAAFPESDRFDHAFNSATIEILRTSSLLCIVSVMLPTWNFTRSFIKLRSHSKGGA